MSDDTTAAIASILGKHTQDGVTCSCGVDMGRPRESDETGFRTKFDHVKHRAHVAAHIAARLTGKGNNE